MRLDNLSSVLFCVSTAGRSGGFSIRFYENGIFKNWPWRIYEVLPVICPKIPLSICLFTESHFSLSRCTTQKTSIPFSHHYVCRPCTNCTKKNPNAMSLTKSNNLSNKLTISNLRFTLWQIREEPYFDDHETERM